MEKRQKLRKEKDNLIIYHYACDKLENRPNIEIGSITVWDSKNKKKTLFSRTSQSEKAMLAKFWKFIKSKYKEGYYFLGWNTKKEYYGFKALKERYYSISKNKVRDIPSSKEFDLDEVIKEEYPIIGDVSLKNLAIWNGNSKKGFIEGLKEIELLKKREFGKLDISINKKVSFIKTILRNYLEGILIVKPVKKNLVDRILDRGQKLKPFSDFLKHLQGFLVIGFFIFIFLIAIIKQIDPFKPSEIKEIEQIAIDCFVERSKEQDRFMDDLIAVQAKKVANDYIVKLKAINLRKFDGSKVYPREYCLLVGVTENKTCSGGTLISKDCKKSPLENIPEIKINLFP